MKHLTKDEKATNYETLQHINVVRNFLNIIVREILERGENHDSSKLEDPELPIFTEYTKKLADTTYDSEDYKKYLQEMKPALDHHYAKNRHHPEHHKDGINDMTLIDLIEMLCDWMAATQRHHDGNILKSLEINSKRFNVSEQLNKILHNTVKKIL